MKNFAYEVVCTDDKGFGLCPDGLWGEYVARADRIFATAAEARSVAQDLRDAGCWGHDVPDFAVERLAVYEALWLDPEDPDEGPVYDRLVEIHGGPIEAVRMPRHVAAFLIAKYDRLASAWGGHSAALRGASSATYSAALAAGYFKERADRVRTLATR
jgi:hypothetical protein